jgi:uncharacterized protein (DUF1778 family)
MARKKTRSNQQEIESRAREVLEFAQTYVRKAADWRELSNALYGPEGKATTLFPTPAERTAFTKTKESKQIHALMNTLPYPPVKETIDLTANANGAISLRLPRSVHAALLAEAKAEGVSLNQLCLSKLVAQLRAVV